MTFEMPLIDVNHCHVPAIYISMENGLFLNSLCRSLLLFHADPINVPHDVSDERKSAAGGSRVEKSKRRSIRSDISGQQEGQS